MNYNIFRIPNTNVPKRNLEDIAKEEIVNGIKDILTKQFSLPKEDLIKEVARIFGYSRISGNVEECINLGIQYALTIEIIVNQNGRLIVKELV
jgi:hypothetical protein